jgi:predicted RNA-binding protein with PIN domain
MERKPKREENPYKHRVPLPPDGPEYLLVDGYNIIFAWENLKKLSESDIEAARNKLTSILSNYAGFKKNKVILVFDAYKVKGGVGSVEEVGGISVVYTKEAETADMYIEKVTHEIGKKHRVRVATSDALEQMIILGHGAMRVSASMFLDEVNAVEKEIREIIE